MKKILFATTNEDKIKEASELLDIEVEGSSLSIEEIQSLDTKKVAEAKCIAYFSALKKPVLVEDVSLVFEGLNGLPGTYINDFSKVLGNGGLCNLLIGKSRAAKAITTLAYIDENEKVSLFEGVIEGTIAEKPKGDGGFGWDAIFIPNGSKKTFAQMSPDEKNQYSMRAKAFEKFKEWFNEN